MEGDQTRNDFESQFWMSMVTAGVWVTFLMCLVGGIYAAEFADDANRLGIAAMVGLAAVSGVLVRWAMPWDRLLASQLRTAAFFTWTVLTIAVIAATAAFDGGAESPLALMLVLPAIFASLAYPLRLVIASALLAESAFLLMLALDTGDTPAPGYVLGFCGALAGAAVMAVWQAKNHDAWRRELARSSRTDPLTGLLNRRGFAAPADAAFSALEREGRPVTLLVIDLDLFKAYNDAHGHQAGDALLRWVAGRLSEVVRPSDSVARLGGDEFAVLLPETDRRDADAVVARIDAALAARTAHCLGRASAPEHGLAFDTLYRAADVDLYRRKVLRPQPTGDASSPQGLMEYRRQRRSISADAVLAGITEAFYVLDEDGRFIYINEHAECLLGRTAEELLGQSALVMFPEAVGSPFEEAIERVTATGEPETFTEFYEPLNRTFSVKASAIPGGISVYLHDVSELHQVASQQRLT